MNRMRNYFGGGQGAPGNPMGGGLPGPFGNMMGLINKFKEFMQNPIGAMMGSGINIPQNIQGNPEAITNYLRSSGQMSDEQFNQLSQMANMAQGFMGKKF